MENHTFMEAIPVKDAKILPTWTVDVRRDSGSVLVGTLTVNHETLPPRKNKKKIAWKLPDDYSMIPKFGEHEKKRLWELFKEQKKERRRQSKNLLGSPEDGEKSDGSNHHHETAGDKALPITANTTPVPSVGEGPDDYGGGTEPPVVKAATQPEPKSNENDPYTTYPAAKENVSPPLPPPPPGFQFTILTPDDKLEKIESPEVSSAPQPAQQFAPPLLTNPLPPPHTNSPPPPPPGLIPTLEPTLPPTLYFTIPDDKPLAALGAVVAPLFLQCVTTSAVVPWLAYSHPTLSQTTLSLGSAQATARTYIDRLQQWQSLTLSNSWDCTGFTSQTLPMRNTVLFVLTGRTIQKQECLAYHLSLVLSSAFAGTNNFQITNEILSLTTLANVA